MWEIGAIGPNARLQGAALGVAALLVIWAVLAGGDGTGPPSGADVWTRQDFFGVNAPLLRDYATPEHERALDALAASMAAAGVRWARLVIDQSVEQRVPGTINWSIPDRVVAALALHGVRTEALFIGTPAWVADPGVHARCGSRSFPNDVGGWSQFVGAAVARYGRLGSFWAAHPEIPRLPIETWEIGNEENTHLFWCPEGDPEKYAEIYSASRSAAVDADPRALVIVGGLAATFDGAGEGDLTVPIFLRRMVEADPSLPAKIPAVAIHPYGQTPERVLETIGRFRDAMRQANLGDTPMIVNEVGWYTSGPPSILFATQAERAARLRELASAAGNTDCNLVAFGVHSWVTTQADPRNAEDWYGLADPLSGVPNESGRAYAAGITAAERNPALREISGPSQPCD